MAYKILQVGRDIADTGGGRVLIETSLHMHRLGHEVIVLSDVNMPMLSDQGVYVLVTPLGACLKQWQPNSRILRISRHFAQLIIFSLFGSWAAASFSRRGHIVFNHNLEIIGGDVLVFHNVFRAEHADRATEKVRKLLRWLNPVFTFRIVREILQLAISRGKVLLAVSKATAEEVKRFVPRDRIVRHINNGVNVQTFAEKQKLTKDDSNDMFHILFVGHEFERKGLKFVLEALTYLPSHVQLTVLGGRGSSRKAYEAISRAFGIEGRVAFLGTLLDTAPYYQAADVFVLPTDYEAWPLVGLESMACCTPVLMTPVGGIPEFLKDGVNGLFIKRDARNIAKKLRFLMDHPVTLARMGVAARATALRYSWESVADEYLNLIHEIEQGKHSRA